MDNNDSAIYEYLISMGAMNPQMDELKKKQAVVDALRKATMPKGEMVGSGGYQHYVGPGLAGMLSTIGQNALGAYGQKKIDAASADMNSAQARALEELRKRMLAGRAGSAGVPVETTYAPYSGSAGNPMEMDF